MYNLLYFKEATVGPGGVLGWQQIQELAEALFSLRNVPAISEVAVDYIVKLWGRLPASLKQSRVCYPPRYRGDKEHSGRFMQKKAKTQTITQGVVSLRRYCNVSCINLNVRE